MVYPSEEVPPITAKHSCSLGATKTTQALPTVTSQPQRGTDKQVDPPREGSTKDQPPNPHGAGRLLSSKYRRIGVPIRHSPSRRISKVCALSQVEARFWNPKIVFTRSTNTSPVQKWSKTRIITPQYLIVFGAYTNICY